MRILHTADLHLGSPLTSISDEAKARVRKMELLETFERMIRYAEENEVNSILICGDLFDSDKVPAKLAGYVLEQIRLASKINFFYIEGNHEGKGVLKQFDNLPENLYLFGDTWSSYALDPEERIVLTGVSVTDKNKMEETLDKLSLDPDKFNLVMLHGQIETEIPLKRLAGKGIDYLALGHVHSYQTGRLDGRGDFCYPGCLEGRGFDECGTHGFVLLDLDEWYPSLEMRFKPFAKRTLHHTSVDVTGITDITHMLAEVLKNLSVENVCSAEDIVDVVLTGTWEDFPERDTQYLERCLAEQFFYARVTDRVKRKVPITEYTGTKSLKGEFIRLVQADRELSEEDRERIIAYGIRALSGEPIWEEQSL